MGGAGSGHFDLKSALPFHSRDERFQAACGHKAHLCIAESAVNQVVSHRMAKKQQMQWTDKGAHRLAQVRVADLNGELSVQRLAALAKIPGGNSSYARQAA
jgi:hypothetical protein